MTAGMVSWAHISYSRLFGCERLARAYSTGWPFSALITPWAPVPSAAWQPRRRFARCISDDDHDIMQSRHEFYAYVTSDQLGGGRSGRRRQAAIFIHRKVNRRLAADVMDAVHDTSFLS